jgi:hypothetical protein
LNITVKNLRENILCDMVGRLKSGEFKFYRGFFYRMGGDAEKFAARITRDLQAAQLEPFKVTDCGEHYTSFNGGAPIQRQSHWWATVKFGV